MIQLFQQIMPQIKSQRSKKSLDKDLYSLPSQAPPHPRRNPAPALILTPKKASLQNFSALILAMLLAMLLGVAQA